MKTRIVLIVGILLFGYSIGMSKESEAGKNQSKVSSMNVFTSPDLYPMTAKWIEEYGKSNPGIKIELITTADLDITKLLKTTTALGFVTNESLASVSNVSAWNMVVGREVIVPVMNQSNPLIEKINNEGFAPNSFARILKTSEKPDWGAAFKNSISDPNNPVHFYFVNDPAINRGIAQFTGMQQIDIKGIKVANEQQLIAAIRSDRNGFGFCRLNNLTNQQNEGNTPAVKLIPIDKNGNGKIDYSEAIYNNLQEFSRGVWVGRFPMALSGKIYTISSARPNNPTELAFLNWVLTDGQQYLNGGGYSDLVANERESQLAKINEPSVQKEIPLQGNPIYMFRFLIILGIGFTVILLDFAVRRVRSKNKATSKSPVNILNVINSAEVVIPGGLYFDKTHTWAFMKKDGTVKLGIDDFLQHVTGPITRVEMIASGETIKKGDHLVTIIQKGKQLNIYSPVTGKITACNKNLIANSGLLNSAPFTDGWVYIVEPTNWLLEIQFMNMAEKYTNWLKTEYSRLRDFFASAVRVHVPAFVMVLQDGGVLRDGILAELGPEVWEDFQTSFIDPMR